MQILFRMTIASSVSRERASGVDIKKLVDWPPDLRMPVKDDVVDLDGTRAVEEVHFVPLGLGPYVTVWLENFIDPDPDECAEIDFPTWTRS